MNRMTEEIRTAIRIEMAKRNINQRELADLAGLSPQHLSQLLTGRSGNLSDGWEKVFAALGKRLAVTDADDDPPARP